MSESVDSGKPAPGADLLENSLKGFVRDQVEAVKVARAEVEEPPTHHRRVEACHLAMRYLEAFEHGQATPEKVLRIAEKFDEFLRRS
jgi:hypothetical protein